MQTFLRKLLHHDLAHNNVNYYNNIVDKVMITIMSLVTITTVLLQ